ncbi:MAG: undecaprenyl/decaprenyl-phosphate alpha-N-acetylglucosaminyl 1-phosphate transferase [Duncaniella sp.]|nr:undecaprenyl/decaprenyl-phosphate alpha-N-acetylglucosaminyl 1-phosphate transferase [Duncaniella sp.]MDE6581928.1 undecaprenyl/decaprenyl-phosphate alpha-N-acetylglucosaminyl 1-phosphate transferase [Duncaniella sp.]
MIFNIVGVFLSCIFFTGVLIPQILLIAFRRKLFDDIDERKIHQGTIPRLGGFAFQPVIMFSIIGALGINIYLNNAEMLDFFIRDAVLIIATFCSLQLLYLIGIADDLVGIKYRAKFVAQVICALMLLAGGVCFNDLHGIFGIYNWPDWIAYPFTVVVMVFLINAINLIDGIDGLASGLSSIACIIYAVAFYLLGEYILSMLAMATLGVLIPFYYFNVFGNADKHSKIFMGDTGTLTIGVLLSVLGTKLFSYDGDIEGIDVAVVAFSPLLVPCFDVVRVYMYRIRHGMNPFNPDKNHIHHRLLAAGFSQRTAMVTIVLTSLLFTCVNALLSLKVNINMIVIIDIVVWLGLMYYLVFRTRRLRRAAAN